MNSISLLWQGLSHYEKVLKKQLQMVNEVACDFRPDLVIGCEHPTVVTLGKRSQGFNDILIPIKDLRARHIDIFTIDRGGHATLHNPGQMVFYPIINLKKREIGVRAFVECLELSTALFLAEYGLEATRSEEPGLWVEGNKIAAFGIRVDKGVSYHGLAINVFNQLKDFEMIKQCGTPSRVTSMEVEMLKFMDKAPDLFLEDLARQWTHIFTQQLNEISCALKQSPLELGAPTGA